LAASKPSVKKQGPPVQGNSNKQTAKPVANALGTLVTERNKFFKRPPSKNPVLRLQRTRLAFEPGCIRRLRPNRTVLQAESNPRRKRFRGAPRVLHPFWEFL